MKLLWVNTNFMHPTTKGGQIRTLEMLRHLHRWHEIHYVAIEDPRHPEGPARAKEYCARAYPFRHRIPGKRSMRFGFLLAKGLFDSTPLAVSRFHPPALRSFLADLIARERFDRAVVDFLPPAAYFPDLPHAVLFQHNVETVIWQRRVQHAADPLRRAYLRLQAKRMFDFEKRVCLASGHVAAVSEQDASTMRELFGVERVSVVPTGVDVDYFTPAGDPPPLPGGGAFDLVFVGSMDWLPNIDGVRWFADEVLPLIRRRRPECSLAIVGRTPPPAMLALERQDPLIRVTGTVPDIRPYLWRSAVSIVPLRIGGGTRLKIYESMAARAAVVSTTIGAEGLDAHPPGDLRLADSPEEFANTCLELLHDAGARRRQAMAAWEMVSSRYSWEHAARAFDAILQSAPPLQLQ